MLTNTFCHIPGIAEKTEQALWSSGVLSWDGASQQAAIRLPRSLQDSWHGHLEDSVQHYQNKNTSYFFNNLASKQHWRLYRDFHDCCAFIDIETTGLSLFAEITTIVLYDGRTIRHYVNGQNLDQFPQDVQEYRLLVTYNGRQFDVPRIEAYFRIKLTQAHIDLRYPLHSLGLKGGLKGCERRLEIARSGLEDVDGFFAVLLWKEYRQRGNRKALETLLAYNMLDTLSLQTLAVHVYNEKVKQTPFSCSHVLPRPLLPSVPFEADSETIRRIREQAIRIGYG